MTASLSAPEHLASHHDLSTFECGNFDLDLWLRKRARANEDAGASRTYVVCTRTRVVGYYAVSTGAVSQRAATGRIRRNMPEPIPVMVLGRLAVDRAWQGRGVGSALLRDAVLRTLNAASIVGIRALLLHAVTDEARRFYSNAGFSESPLDPLTMMLALRDAERMLAIH